MKNPRTLKVYETFQARQWKYIAIPEIQLKGKWLRDLGFEIGDQIEIKQQKNKLTITLTEKKKEK